MKSFFTAYLAALIPFVLIDAVWLSTMAKRLYQPEIGHLMADNPNFSAAAIFYLLYIGGIVFFVLQPAIAQNLSIPQTALHGALFGFITYATYDLTNQATLKNWSTLVTVIDLAWGTFLGATVSALALWGLKRFVGV